MSLVDHPKHYNFGGPIDEDGSARYEVIKLIEDLGWGFDFCMANALKYLLRAPYKGAESQDLDKARWYLRRARGLDGRVRPDVARRLDMSAALAAWGLMEAGTALADAGPLARAVARIGEGDASGALRALAALKGQGSPQTP